MFEFCPPFDKKFALDESQFEACGASIAARATDLIGIHESDNGRKWE